MQSKRDQVQAHSFVMGRLSTGLLLASPDAPESPHGRTTRGVLFGLLATLLVAAGATVFGLLRPGGNDSWRSGENLVVNHDTGARYLYTGGALHPVRNYASARLIGGPDLDTTDVGTDSLRGTPVGSPVGIPGAPDSVPGSGDLDDDPWHLCVTGPSGALPRTSSGGESAVDKPGATTVVAGAPVATEAVEENGAVLVRGPDKQEYLVWRGSRLPLDRDAQARNALGYGSHTPVRVSAAFLNALAPGPELAPPEAPGRGASGPELGGTATRIGQVFKVAVPGSGTSGYYLLRDDGLAELTRTGAALVLGDPATQRRAYAGESPRARTVGADALRQHRAKSPAATAGSDELPTAPPGLRTVPRGSAVCAEVEGGTKGVRISSTLVRLTELRPVAVPRLPAGTLATPCVRAEASVLRPGHGALVRALNASGSAHGGAVYLVTEHGVKYQIRSEAELQALGYQPEDVGSVPTPLLATLPTGSDLDERAAKGAAEPRVSTPSCEAQKKDIEQAVGLNSQSSF